MTSIGPGQQGGAGGLRRLRDGACRCAAVAALGVAGALWGGGALGAVGAARVGAPAVTHAAPAREGTEAGAGVGPGGSLEERYFHRSWRHGDGLPGNSVYAIAQTSDGYLWLGTDNGLARFDGHSFQRFGERSPGVFRSRFVAALAAGRDGTLWIGTERGLLRMRGGVLAREGAAGGLAAEAAVSALAEDAGGNLWIGTRSGLLRRGALTGQMSPIGLGGVRVTALRAGETGEVWIGTEAHGPWRFHAGRLERITAEPRLVRATVTALVRDQDGSVLVFSSAAAARFQGGAAVSLAPAGAPAILNVAGAGSGGGALWLGTTDRGVVQISGGRTWFASRDEPLAAAVVFQVFVAADRTVWFGTAGDGLRQLVEKSCRTYTRRDGIASEATTTVLVESDGAIWIGTNSGLTRMQRRSGDAAFVHTELAGTPMTSLLRDHQGTLWAGTERGLFRRLGDGRWELLPAWGPEATMAVNNVFEDRSWNIWVGTSGGLGRVSPAAARVVAVPGLEGQEVIGVADADDGSLWIGTRGAGLLRLRHGTLETLRSAADLPIIAVVRRDLAGGMWIGTFGGGLLHYSDGRWTRFDEDNGLADNTVRQLREDANGGVWICSGAGISRISRGSIADLEAGRAAQVVPLAYGPEDGVVEATCYGESHPGSALSADGHLWFTTNHGLVELRPERRMAPPAPPVPRLDRVTVDGRDVAIPRAARLLIPGDTHRVELRFSAPVFVAHGRTAIRYRLVGLHSEWILDGGERLARYTSLDAGSYRFEVMVRDAGGMWSAPVALAEIEAEPRFYRRFSFQALVALALIGCAFGAHRLAERRLLRRAVALEIEVRERTEQLEVANARLAAMAATDALTGLANRRTLQETIEREVRRAARGRRELSLVMVDVDFFKRYNDSLGHLGGDECLRQVAMALRSAATRPADLAARYGGEEFAILLPETSEAQALVIAERLRQTVEKLALPHPSSPVAGWVTLSAGVVGLVPEVGTDAVALIAAADEALYRAKQAGRNRALAAEDRAATAAGTPRRVSAAA